MKRTGFTLIELLVIVVIIAIVAAILFPMFSQARTAAKVVIRLSNAKQQGTALMMYETDFNDIHPNANFNEAYLGAFPVRVGEGNGAENQWLLPDRLAPYIKDRDIYVNDYLELRILWDESLKKAENGGAKSTGGWNYLCPSTDPNEQTPSAQNPLRVLSQLYGNGVTPDKLAERFTCGRRSDKFETLLPAIMFDGVVQEKVSGAYWEKSFFPKRIGGRSDGTQIGKLLIVFSDSSARTFTVNFDEFLKKLRISE